MARRAQRAAQIVTLGGLLLAAVGVYGIIDAGSLFGLGLPILALAAVLSGMGMAMGGRRSTRTRYRPDPWRWPEWTVAGSGLLGLVVMTIAHALDVPGLVISFLPLAAPPVPFAAGAGLLIGALPALLVPTPRTIQAPLSPHEAAVEQTSKLSKVTA
jgi:energy-coupling factor transport system permease protein